MPRVFGHLFTTPTLCLVSEFLHKNEISAVLFLFSLLFQNPLKPLNPTNVWLFYRESSKGGRSLTRYLNNPANSNSSLNPQPFAFLSSLPPTVRSTEKTILTCVSFWLLLAPAGPYSFACGHSLGLGDLVQDYTRLRAFGTCLSVLRPSKPPPHIQFFCLPRPINSLIQGVPSPSFISLLHQPSTNWACSHQPAVEITSKQKRVHRLVYVLVPALSST